MYTNTKVVDLTLCRHLGRSEQIDDKIRRFERL